MQKQWIFLAAIALFAFCIFAQSFYVSSKGPFTLEAPQQGFLARPADVDPAVVASLQATVERLSGAIAAQTDLIQQLRAEVNARPSDAVPTPAPVVASRNVESTGTQRRQEVVERVTAAIQKRQAPIHEYATTNYMVYVEPMGVGIGNRINAVISAMLFALASNRTLLVQSSEFLDEFAPSFPWHIDNFDTVFTAEQRANRVNLLFECCNNNNKTWNDWLGQSGRPFVMNLDLGENSLFNNFICHDWAATYRDVKFLELSTNQYFAVAAINNPHYSHFMAPLFDNYEPMGIMARSMFLTAPHIRAIVDKFKESNAFASHYMAGIQIRTGHLKSNGHFQGDPIPLMMRFFHCADKAEFVYRQKVDDTRPSRFFLCGDDQKLIQELKQKLGDRVVTFSTDLLPTGLQDHVFIAYHRLVEILIVSECDNMVLSDFSTFSALASGLSAKRPYVMLQEGLCYERLNAEPCFTYSWALPYQSCYANVSAYQRDWAMCQHDFWRNDPWQPRN
eukprot:TRINITY_DN26790_c0_g1_i1.p1 TRINITY_DN26790_c0_g1~~TRINITY_DN26790_c0_g1_i1.p1  ORF type:complete len:505 (+),score=159.73 TRINITY_DN26790_c0_g1_i1:172-1686(+)